MQSSSKRIEIKKYPKDWMVVRLGEKCEFLDRLRIPIKEQDRTKRGGSYPYYGAQGIIDWIDDYIFDGEYILLAEDGENLHSKKLPLAYKVTGKFWVNNHAHVLKVKNNGIIDKYLLYVLNFIDIRTYIVGSAQPKLNQSDAIKIEILLPPLPEQRRIAEVLGTVDSAIQKVGGAIESTERLKKGLMQRLLTKGIGHERFKESEVGRVPEEWEVVRLEDAVEINRESRDPTSVNQDGKFLYIDIESVVGGTGAIKSAKEILGKDAPSRARRIIHQNDVIMSTVRPYLKAFALVPREYNNQICSTGFAVLSCKNEILPHYLLYTIFSKMVIDQCNKMMMGGQYPAINQSQVAKIEILLPPLPEQRRIAEILSAVDRKLELERLRKEKLERVKKGLMNELLTGRKRVKV